MPEKNALFERFLTSAHEDSRTRSRRRPLSASVVRLRVDAWARVVGRKRGAPATPGYTESGDEAIVWAVREGGGMDQRGRLEKQRECDSYYAALPREGYASRCEMLLPNDLEGRRVLDLGCRSGKGACKLADLVGARGRVLGVDPSAAFIERACDLVRRHREQGDAWATRLAFETACFEDLREAGVGDESFDVVVVNSVLNLAFDLEGSLREVARVLVAGGFLYHAGVFADAPPSACGAQSAAMQGGVFGRARTQGEFERLALAAGFSNCAFEERETVAADPDDAAMLEGMTFHVAIVRAMKGSRI